MKPRSLLVLGVAIALAAAGAASAATITVDTTADDTAVNGNCTLREAVIAANTNAAVDACTAGTGPDLIVVPAGTYVLTLTGAIEDAAATGDLDITESVEIDGAGAATTIIDGNATDRVFDIDPLSTGIDVTLSALTVRNGQPPIEGTTIDGGGVRTHGTLHLDGCVVTNNTASGAAEANGGGISGTGTLSVTATTISSNSATSDLTIDPDIGSAVARGGGIFMIGALTITGSAVRSNRTDARGFQPESAGGGILSNGPLDIARSSVRDNIAYKNGPGGLAEHGGISSLGDFTLTDSSVSHNIADPGVFPVAISTNGGIGAGAGTCTITRSTISDNTARFTGGIGFGEGALILRNSTVSNNDGGGIVLGLDAAATLLNCTVSHNTPAPLVAGGITPYDNTVSITFRNTIIANNGTPNCAEYTTSNPITATGDAYNLASDNTCGLSGSDLVGVDPLLGPLQDNGGPTQTRALLAGSPAREAGSPDPPGSGGTACEATDQRGAGRPRGPRCDIGAFEATVCGDGTVDPGEACDDGGTTSGDGCSAVCAVEQCYVCAGSPSVCTPIDGAPCDDGNACTAGEVCTGATCGGGSPTSCLDHYKCYAAKDLQQPEFVRTDVTLADQFGTENGVAVLRPAFLCNPVDKAGSGINNPTDHLACYHIGGRRNLHAVEVTNQLGTLRLRTLKSKLLCVPASKTVTP